MAQQEMLIERFFETLIAGERPAARSVVQQATQVYATPQDLIMNLFWPTHQLLEKLYRADQLSRISHHAATRLLRQLVDQNASRMTFNYTQNKKVLAFCGPSENEELGAQMSVDILEAAGFEVFFGGSGIANDEVLARVNETKPGVLLMFCSAPQDLPGIRELIDTLREINASPTTQIAVGGGVFNRAEGLAEEIGADLWATSPMQMVETIIDEPTRRAEVNQRTVGKQRKPKQAKAA